MNYQLSNLCKVSGAILTLFLSACASQTQAPSETRYVGFKEELTFNAETLHSGTELTEYSRLMGKPDFSTRPGSRTWFATHLSIPRAIVTREFASGSLASNFGKRTELIFRVQQCFNSKIIDRIITCTDSSQSPVMTARTALTLKGGETVVAKFPNGMEWRYTVLDQNNSY